MSSPTHRGRHAPAGPTQRQLRAGELVRHALADILRSGSFIDPALDGAPVTVSEVRVSPDLKHAVCFVEPLGGQDAPATVEALNRAARLLRGRLGHAIDMKFTPDLKFVHDDSFDNARRIDRLLDDPRVRRDVEAGEPDEPDGA
jgi:ribosome-binding factor A